MNRKGSLNLSIQTIVVVVLAMALLGLGLGFVRNQISSVSETGTLVQEQAREQITEQLRLSGEKISFPREITMSRGERSTISLGVQNTKSAQLIYKVNVDFDLDNSDFDTLGLTPDDFELRWDSTCRTIGPAQSEVFGINALPPREGGTYALRADILEYADEASCDADTDFSQGTSFGRKLAFITVG